MSCFEGYPQFEVLIGHLVRYLHAKAETTEKEYLAVADEKISKKVADKATEIDACYEHSRNLAGVKPEETTINFCRYVIYRLINFKKY